MKDFDQSTQPLKTQPIVVPAKKQVKPKRSLWSAITVLTASLMLLFFLVSAAIIIIFNSNRIILPGIHVLDLDLGLKTQTQAATLIDQVWNKETNLILENGSHSFAIKANELGLVTDAQATAWQAYQIGHGRDSLEEIKTLVRDRNSMLLPVVNFDAELARQFLEALSQTISNPALEAQILFSDNKWITTPGQSGITLDVDTTLELLGVNPLLTVMSGQATLVMTPVQPVVADLSPLLGQITNLLDSELSLTAYDPITDEHFSWSVPEKLLATWVAVDITAGDVWVDPNIEDVRNLISDWNLTLGGTRILSRSDNPTDLIKAWQALQVVKSEIYHLPIVHTVQSNESLWGLSLKYGMPLYRIMDANPNLTTNNLYAGVQLTIPSKNDLLPLPVIENKRIVISIAEQRLWTYEDGLLRSEHIISTGISDSPTMAGIFQVQTHLLNAYASNWDLWMPHFLGIYEAWPDFMNGIHGLPLLSSGVRLWASNLGRPASYGCIIMDLNAAESLYNWAEDGVVVEIRP